ncbi:hypothetical protein AB0B92_16490 [Streptomyces hygroscopicus]|uniref:hypothetical protein n=1 Tax=Streptomyces hygroscopicus TaxID=1912 RepID=UPI00340578B9
MHISEMFRLVRGTGHILGLLGVLHRDQVALRPARRAPRTPRGTSSRPWTPAWPGPGRRQWRDGARPLFAPVGRYGHRARGTRHAWQSHRARTAGAAPAGRRRSASVSRRV